MQRMESKSTPDEKSSSTTDLTMEEAILKFNTDTIETLLANPFSKIDYSLADDALHILSERLTYNENDEILHRQTNSVLQIFERVNIKFRFAKNAIRKHQISTAIDIVNSIDSKLRETDQGKGNVLTQISYLFYLCANEQERTLLIHEAADHTKLLDDVIEKNNVEFLKLVLDNNPSLTDTAIMKAATCKTTTKETLSFILNHYAIGHACPTAKEEALTEAIKSGSLSKATLIYDHFRRPLTIYEKVWLRVSTKPEMKYLFCHDALKNYITYETKKMSTKCCFFKYSPLDKIYAAETLKRSLAEKDIILASLAKIHPVLNDSAKLNNLYKIAMTCK